MTMQSQSDLNGTPRFLSGTTFAKDNATIQQDAARVAALATYTVMAMVGTSVPATGTADAGNTGDGTCTAVAFAAGGPIREGTFTLECVTAVTNGGIFELRDPDDNVIAAPLVMTAGAGAATEFAAGGLFFTLTDGATDFVSGDLFTIAATAVDKWIPFNPSAVNGGKTPAGIFVGDAITAAALVAGDVATQPIVIGGLATFDPTRIVFDDGSTDIDTVIQGGQTVRQALAKLGLYAEDAVSIDSFQA